MERAEQGDSRAFAVLENFSNHMAGVYEQAERLDGSR